MKIVLLEDVEKLGYAGDIKEVKDGYAKNYLIPKGLALAATRSNLKLVEEKRRAILRKIEKRIAEANKIKEALDGVEIEIKARAGEKGKLFGSVTANEIYEKLKEKVENLDKKSIRLPDGGIREVGEHTVEIAIYRDIKAQVKVKVSPLDEQ